SANGKIAAIENETIAVYNSITDSTKILIAISKTTIVKKLVWSKNGKTLAFLEGHSAELTSDDELKIQVFDTAKRTSYTLTNSNLGKNKITDYIQTPLLLSDDGSQLFFYYRSTPSLIADDNIVEVWDSKTKLAYPAAKIYGDPALKPKLAVWNVK